jgi:hypothetical protein
MPANGYMGCAPCRKAERPDPTQKTEHMDAGRTGPARDVRLPSSAAKPPPPDDVAIARELTGRPQLEIVDEGCNGSRWFTHTSPVVKATCVRITGSHMRQDGTDNEEATGDETSKLHLPS